jgi:hypothetical protein
MFGQREPERTELTPELKALEQQLAALTPAPPRIDRDRLMFEAGRAAGLAERMGDRPEPSSFRSKLWPAAAAMMTAACMLLSTMLIWQRESTRVATQPVLQPVAPVATQLQVVQPAVQSDFAWNAWQARQQLSTGYLGIRQVALTRGVNAIESTFSAASNVRDAGEKSEASQRRMLNELLPGSRIELMPRS